MSTLSDQIRELQKRLEQINEAESPEVAAAQAASNTQSPPADGTTVAPAAAPAADPNQIPTIEAPTFSQAYAKAKKMGLKKFKWCGIYAVKDAVRPQPVPPKPKPTPEPVQGVTTNPMGDFDPTAFSGDFTGGTKR